MSTLRGGGHAPVVVVSRDPAVRRRAVRSLVRRGLRAVDVTHLDLVGEHSPGVGCVLVDHRQPELGGDLAARLGAGGGPGGADLVILDAGALHNLCRDRDLESLLARIELGARAEAAAGGDGPADPGARPSSGLSEQVAALAAELAAERHSHLTTVRRHAHEAARMQARIVAARLEIESLRADLARAVGARLSGAA